MIVLDLMTAEIRLRMAAEKRLRVALFASAMTALVKYSFSINSRGVQ